MSEEPSDEAVEERAETPEPEKTETSPSEPARREVAILPSGNVVLYPLIIMPLSSREERMLKLIGEAAAEDDPIALFAQKEDPESWRADTLYEVGTLSNVARMMRLPDGSMQALIQGQSRIKLVQMIQEEPYLKGIVEVVEDYVGDEETIEGALRNLSTQFQRAVGLSPNLPEALSLEVAQITSPGALADFVAANINLPPEEQQEILEAIDVSERIRKVTVFLNRELEILEIGSKIQSQIKEGMDKSQREFYLRQQLAAIRDELGEGDERVAEVEDLRKRLTEAELPEAARKEADRELDRLSGMPPASPEASVIKTYLELIISLPWNESTEDNLDINQAQKTLNEDHYDLDEVKDRILDYLAVRRLNPDMKGSILCFVGPPGVGKTSLGRSIAGAMGRKFIRFSLGGVRDEAEIRGHRRTYIGALPGRIIQEMRRAESNNPVMMLDEIDKVGSDFRSDLTSSLLEVLDPEQNHTFIDHYLDVPFDLSHVMFITTANQLEPIPAPLRDRMETIEIPGYTELEKLAIAQRFLVPKQIKENGLSDAVVEFGAEGLKKIIQRYTRESGVRNLEREIGSICRKIPARRRRKHGARDDRGGIGGRDPRQGEIPLRGGRAKGRDRRRDRSSLDARRRRRALRRGDACARQGSVQSDRPARRRHAGVGPGGFDLYQGPGSRARDPRQVLRGTRYPRARARRRHTPKDGPSAGVTMAAAIISAVTRRPIDSSTAMTGEITLRGKVLPVGGIKEKVLAAHRAGAKWVMMPRENERDWEEVPEEIRSEMKVEFLDFIDEALKLVLLPAPKGAAAAEKEPARVA